MGLISRVKIGTRLACAFALLLMLLAVMTASGLSQAGRLQSNTEYYEGNLFPALKTISAFYQGISDARRTTFLLITLSDAAEIKKVEQRFAKELKTAREQLDAYESRGLIYDEEDRRLWSAAKDTVVSWVVEHDKVLAANRARLTDPTQAEQATQIMLGSARVANLAVIKASEEWQRYRDVVAQKVTQRGRDTYREVMWMLAIVAGAALVLGVVAAVAITRSITRPLDQAVAITNAVADGDLTATTSSEAQDELGVLLRSLDKMTGNLRRMVLAVRTGTESIATASSQIAQGNGDLSSRTEQQAASLQETAASMQQMSSAVSHAADNARAASELSGEASKVAAQGGTAVSQVVQTMEGIQAASRKISDIISVIDGIAFQTNILALNAAVEAARAGEQGRGFAVVAGEVRNLAQRSAQAAKEIKSLITESVEKIDTGTSQAAATGTTMQDVVVHVRRVTELIRDITASSSEQSEGIGQINAAVSQLDQTTQQNAALVEQTSAAAESLAQQAAALAQAVGAFRIDGPAATQHSFAAEPAFAA
jgi:methyl-accepting chemotaxis protein